MQTDACIVCMFGLSSCNLHHVVCECANVVSMFCGIILVLQSNTFMRMTFDLCTDKHVGVRTDLLVLNGNFP